MGQLQQPKRRRRLAVVVSCTATKSTPAPPDLLLRSLPPGPGRLHHWVKRLEEQPTRRRLRDLYAGPTWHAALRLEAGAKELGHKVSLWVASAGVGLASAEERAPSYGATFAAGADQVSDTPHGRRAWWTGLQAQGLWDRHAGLTTVREQADQLLLVLSPTYLEVLEGELAQFQSDDGVAIMSSGTPGARHTLSSSGLRDELGGTQMTVNARAASAYLRIIGDAPIGRTESRQRWAEWADGRRRTSAATRPALSDDDVRNFIRASTQGAPVSRTRLLGELRRSGWACEQGRFARLYEKARTEQ